MHFALERVALRVRYPCTLSESRLSLDDSDSLMVLRAAHGHAQPQARSIALAAAAGAAAPVPTGAASTLVSYRVTHTGLATERDTHITNTSTAARVTTPYH